MRDGKRCGTRQGTPDESGSLADVVLSASVIDAVRKEVRRASKYNPEADEVARIRRHDVIRPELLVK